MADPDSTAAMARPYVGATVVSLVLTSLVVFAADAGSRVLWFKTLHVIAVVSWFAGIFYLPRLFVYHATVPESDVEGRERFCLMERKLYRFVTMFMVLTVVFGTAMIVEYGMEFFRLSTWLHVKITLVLALLGFHFWMGAHGRALRGGKPPYSHKRYRVLNELPVLVLFAVVWLVILKPSF